MDTKDEAPIFKISDRLASDIARDFVLLLATKGTRRILIPYYWPYHSWWTRICKMILVQLWIRILRHTLPVRYSAHWIDATISEISDERTIIAEVQRKVCEGLIRFLSHLRSTDDVAPVQLATDGQFNTDLIASLADTRYFAIPIVDMRYHKDLFIEIDGTIAEHGPLVFPVGTIQAAHHNDLVFYPKKIPEVMPVPVPDGWVRAKIVERT